MLEWSPQQSKALKAIAKWLADPRAPQVMRVFGWAGTGKTSMAREIADQAGGALFACFTGKAALVLRKKGCRDASTLHSLIYKPQEDVITGEVTFKLNPDSPLASAAFLIVDEVSMVGGELGVDVLSFGTKVLVLGDPFQLPPINGEGYFTSKERDIMLTEIHRQAADNPIIRMSMDVREGRELKLGTYGNSKVITRMELQREEVIEADQVLVGMNKTRRVFNNRIRVLSGMAPGPDLFGAAQGAADLPIPGDRLVCLKNNRMKGLLNGSLWSVTRSECRNGVKMKMTVSSLDEENIPTVDVDTPVEFFRGGEKDLPWTTRKYADEFDYGYALTVHKGQGSQFDDVMLFDESSVFRENALKHRYTGITRAAERITVVL